MEINSQIHLKFNIHRHRNKVIIYKIIKLKDSKLDLK